MNKGVKMTRKHYNAISKAIKDNSIELIDETTQDGNSKEYINKGGLINDLSIIFQNDNSLFNWRRFVDACEIDKQDDFELLSPKEQAKEIYLNDIKYLDNEL